MASEMDDNNSNESSNIPQLKRKRDDDFVCILQCGKPWSEGDSLDNISLKRWNSIQDKAIKWKGLDKFMHSSCYTTMSGSRKLSQAKQWQQATDHSQQECADVSDDQIPSASSEPKRLCASTGRVHDKTLCVWCM